MLLRNCLEKCKRLLYPNRCACCSRVLPAGQKLCGDCGDQLPRIEQPACRRCGQARSNCLCARHPRPLYFDGCCAPFAYTGVVRNGIWQFKFRGRVDGAAFFAAEMAAALRTTCPTLRPTGICYVPLSKKRRRERGYNQAELLAEEIAGILECPVAHSLHKVRENKVQHELRFSDRQENVRNVYVCDGDFTGQTLLLVDDIKTTGSTLNACAKLLKEAGAKKVVCLTAAIVPPKGL